MIVVRLQHISSRLFLLGPPHNKELVYVKAACVGCYVIEESVYRTRLLITCHHNLINCHRIDFVWLYVRVTLIFKENCPCCAKAGIWCTRLRKVKRNREYIDKIYFTERNTFAILKAFE